jgi:hypothetical protein
MYPSFDFVANNRQPMSLASAPLTELIPRNPASRLLISNPHIKAFFLQNIGIIFAFSELYIEIY